MQPSHQPLRAALYARYSTDRQRDTSIDDQLRAARQRAAVEGWPIVAEHRDQETSGSVPVALRTGGKALLADALAGRIDVLVLEGLDRLSRDLGEQEQVVKRLEYRGMRIIGTSDGYDTSAKGRKVMRVARGLVNELYLDDLRDKTHRGLAGQFGRGYHVGGVCFGYRSEPAPDGRGRMLVISQQQAEIVRRIFSAYAAGESARAIVHRLNGECAPSPRGGTWTVSALVGDRKRGAGLLNNELYAGRQVWNRRQWLKDPETGRRRYVDRPAAEWQVRECPELRIVVAEVWQAVRERDRRRSSSSPKGGAPMRTLFAGLLRCPVCGGPMTAIDARRYGCNRHTDRGDAACTNGLAYPRKAVENALLTVVRADLLSPAAMAEMHLAMRRIAAEATKAPAAEAQRSRIQALGAEIARLVDAVAQLGMSEALRSRLEAAEAERANLLTRAAEAAAAPATMSAAQLVADYRRRMLDLRQALERDADRERTRALLADMLGPVRLVRDAKGDWAEMEEPAQRLALAGSPLSMVAGARNSGWRRVRVR